MIIEYIKSVYENVKDRLKNPFRDTNKTPFAGAFIIALLLYNWELVFSILTFDSFETRTTKISIIKNYLVSETWYKRVLITIGFAFASITIFYFFNYLSLGITTFFRRWFKGVILHYTDRGQNVPRDEYEKNNLRANTIKRNYDGLKESVSRLEDERHTLSSQLTNLTSQFANATEEIERLKKENQESVNRSTEEENKLIVLFAQYGVENEMRDVTQIVFDLVSKTTKFIADNKTLGIDPLKFSVKRLFVIYKFGKATKTLTANEDEEIEIRDNELVATPTETSKIKQTYVVNEKGIAEIFTGEWTLTSKKDGKTFSEKVLIDDTGKYFSNYKHTFYLKTIRIDRGNKKILFNKVSLKQTLHSKEDLTIVDNNLVKGADSLGYALEYKKTN